MTLPEWLSTFPSDTKFIMKKIAGVTILRQEGTDNMFVLKQHPVGLIGSQYKVKESRDQRTN